MAVATRPATTHKQGRLYVRVRSTLLLLLISCSMPNSQRRAVNYFKAFDRPFASQLAIQMSHACMHADKYVRIGSASLVVARRWKRHLTGWAHLSGRQKTGEGVLGCACAALHVRWRKIDRRGYGLAQQANQDLALLDSLIQFIVNEFLIKK